MLKQNQKGGTLATVLIIVTIVLLLAVIGAGATGYFLWKKGKEKVKEVAEDVSEEIEKITEDVDKSSEVQASQFATYKEEKSEVKPSVKPYQVEAGLSNIDNAKDFEMSNEAKKLLEENAFVVTPGTSKEFFQLYDANRYENIPSFITTDSMLHTYHLIFALSLKQLEKNTMIPELKKLNQSMLEISQAQYEDLKGTNLENAAKRNIAFYTVASKLLDDNTEIPSIVKTEVEKELALIEKHEKEDDSPIMNMGQKSGTSYKEDYSQYIPRGHYTKSDEFKAYFKAMMWYGRMTFRLKSEDEVRSALLATYGLMPESNFATWEKIYEPINFFVGKSDDITYYDFSTLMKEAYGENININDLEDETKLANFISKAKELDPPQINSIPIFDARFEKDRNEEIMGFRFMGQRFTIDASIFQRLIYREVGDKEHTCKDDPEIWNPRESRRLPRALDIPAAFGSEEAYKILDEYGHTDYACYQENMEKMQKYVEEQSIDTWTQNLYWGWMYNLKPLTIAKGKGYPTFMQNQAWQRKELNTFLGSWTELKHDTILYAKQVYAELGGLFEEQPKGYVEPNTEVYNRLIALSKMTKEGLETRDILSDTVKSNLESMEELAEQLKTISEKELKEEKLTDEEYELIRYFGGDLEQFWLDAYKDEGIESIAQIDDKPAALIADVATDPAAGVAVEEGIGNIYEIIVAVPIEGRIVLTKGGVFSQYEFEHPISDRLTDEKWREMIKNNEEPDFAEWQKSFMAE